MVATAVQFYVWTNHWQKLCIMVSLSSGTSSPEATSKTEVEAAPRPSICNVTPTLSCGTGEGVRGRGGIVAEDEDACTVMVYEQGVGWRTLPRYQYRWFAMAVLQNQLTQVGGQDSFKVTNQISVWYSQQWTHPYPPMPTSRHSPAVATYINWLVVAGGSDGSSVFSTVEIMDTTTKQWFTATPCTPHDHGML